MISQGSKIPDDCQTSGPGAVYNLGYELGNHEFPEFSQLRSVTQV